MIKLKHICFIISALSFLISCDKTPVSTSENTTTVAQKENTFDPELYFKEFGIENGLISTELLNVYNDQRGFTWIATGKGVVRYDGYEFKNYFSNSEKNVFLEGASYFYEDRDNTFWLMSGNGYLYQYDAQTDAFVYQKSKLENGWSAENPLRIFEEKSGNIWLGGYGGLQYLDKRTDSLTLYPISKIREAAWPHEEKIRFEVIQEDSKGILWLGTRKFGLVKFDPFQKKYSFFRDKPGYIDIKLDDWITDIIPADSATFWIADYNVGLTKFNPITEEIVETLSFKKYARNGENIYIRDILSFGDYLLLATDGSGLLIYNTVSQKVVQHFNNDSPVGQTTANHIKRIVMDKKANVWLIDDKLRLGSVAYYGFQQLPFPENVKDKSVYSLSASQMASSESKLIISTPKHTILYDADKGTSTAKSYLLPKSTKNYAVLATRNGEFYSSDEHRIVQINSENNSVISSYDTHQILDVANNSLRRATAYLEDTQGTIWTIDHWGRLKYIDRSSGKVGNIFALAQDVQTKKFINVLCFIDDPDNSRIIVGTDMGLATVKYVTHTVDWYAVKSNNIDLSGSIFSTLYQDKAQQLWGLINEQLYTLNISSGEARPFNELDGLEAVKWMVEEPRGTFWFNANSGIIRLDKKTKHVTTFENPNFSEGSVKKPSPVTVLNNKIYYGGENGVTVIEPQRLTINKNPPDLYITEFGFPQKSNNGSVEDTTIRIVNQPEIELEYFQNDLTFFYNGIEYKNSELNQYAFFLQGYDTDWINVGSQRSAIYTNISPGTYTFWVKAANSDGVWTPNSVSFRVIIHPPWWQTWWAYLLYVLLAAAAIYGWIKYQVYRKTLLLKKNERLRTKISSDLHDEVGTILSGLAMKSELMSYTVPESEQAGLTEISNMSKDAMERMRDTVWAIDSRKDNYENLIDRMREFATQNLSLKNIQHKFITENLNPEAFISPEKRQNTYLIFKEAITNVLKHSDANNVEVKLATTANRFMLVLKDNGSHKANYTSSGQGTSNMKMRAEGMGGTLYTIYEGGFVLNLEFPLK